MSLRLFWICTVFLAIACGIPFLLWVLLTALRMLLLPVFISDESLWLHSVPFFVELVCFALYERHKSEDFDAMAPPIRREASGRPLPPEPARNLRRAKFVLTWKAEAKNDCRLNLLYIAVGSPLTCIFVIVTAYFFPTWGFANFLICTACGVVALGVLGIIAEKHGLRHGLPPFQPLHDYRNVRPSPPEARGKGLTTQQEAQEFWLKEEKERTPT
jgi:hypothetical protein